MATSNNPSTTAAITAQQSASLPTLIEPDLESKLLTLRERARNHVEQAISLMPQDEKMEYLEARERAPMVVDMETDALKFVRRCDYNVWSAGKRICAYWKERKFYFAQDRFFLPLDLSGNGAMTVDDVSELQAGFPAMLPPTTSGQQVIVFDRRQWVTEDAVVQRMRCLFYIFNVLAEDDRAQSEGVLVLDHLVTPRIYKFCEEKARACATLIRDVMPVKIHLHMLSWLPKVKARKLYVIQDIMTAGVSVAMEIFHGQFDVHIEREPGQLVEELQELGLTMAGIPFCVGGEWKFHQVASWCSTRHETERSKYTPVYASLPTSFPLPIDTPIKEEEQDAQEKKRQANVVHSRRKRERRRQEFQSLKIETEQLTEMKQSLETESRRLERILQEAQEALATQGLSVTLPRQSTIPPFESYDLYREVSPESFSRPVKKTRNNGSS